MSLEQFAAFVKLLPEIEQAVQQQGESLPRPVYSGSVAKNSDNHEQGDSARTESPGKPNIEATSDEESDS